jgi:hypothetical protein
MRSNYFNRNKQPWTGPELILINTDQIKQEISQQDSELLNLLSSDENAFRLLTGSV